MVGRTCALKVGIFCENTKPEPGDRLGHQKRRPHKQQWNKPDVLSVDGHWNFLTPKPSEWTWTDVTSVQTNTNYPICATASENWICKFGCVVRRQYNCIYWSYRTLWFSVLVYVACGNPSIIAGLGGEVTQSCEAIYIYIHTDTHTQNKTVKGTATLPWEGRGWMQGQISSIMTALL
jgi:hypothetical protein